MIYFALPGGGDPHPRKKPNRRERVAMWMISGLAHCACFSDTSDGPAPDDATSSAELAGTSSTTGSTSSSTTGSTSSSSTALVCAPADTPCAELDGRVCCTRGCDLVSMCVDGQVSRCCAS